MIADTILASGKPFTVVLKATFDVQTVLGLQFQESHLNILGQPAEVEEVDDSLVYISSNPVKGLSSIEAILERPFFEEYLGDAFTAQVNYQITALNLHVNDDLLISKQSLMNRPYELYIGYIDDDWGDFELWLTGKTLGGVRNRDTLRLDLSTSSIYGQDLFPVNTYSDGRAIPFLYGTAYRFKPVLRPQGDYQFHDGILNIPTGNYKSISPSIFMDFDSEEYLGDITFTIVNTDFSEEESTATDALPVEINGSVDGKIRPVDDYIEVTIPDSSSDAPGIAPFKEIAVIALAPKTVAGGSIEDTVTYYEEWDLRLNDASSVDSYIVENKVLASIVVAELRKEEVVTLRTPLITGSLSSSTEFVFKKLDADDADDVIVDVLGFRRIFKSGETQEVQVYDSAGVKYPTRRIGDVDDTTEVKGIALYDDHGLLKVPDDLVEFSIDATGYLDEFALNEVVRTVDAAASMADLATGGAVSVTASFIGEPIGYFCRDQKPWLEHVREMVRYSDYVIRQNLTDDDVVLERRYNYQPRTFDNVDNDVNQFTISIDDFDPASINQGIAKVGASRYIVRYQLNQTEPGKSPVSTDFNSEGILSKVDIINSYFASEVNAIECASLVGRGAAEVIPVTLQVFGQGLGIRTNMVGVIESDEIRSGAAHVRRVREVEENTEIQVDIYV